MLKEFRNFVLRGNVIDLAVAFILGAAFTTIVRSLANDILMPPIGLLFGDVDFNEFFAVLKQGTPAGPYSTLAAAKEAGAVVISYGVFVTSVITFLLTALALFFVVRALSRAQEVRRKEEATVPAAPTTKECPHCFSKLDLRATRCAYCTSEV